MGDIADAILNDGIEDFYWFENKQCSYCGRRELHWGLTNRGWRLFNDREEMHSCSKYLEENHD